MRRFRPTLAAALLAVVTLTSMGPAAAGGPTSALLSVPGEGKTASLYYTDPRLRPSRRPGGDRRQRRVRDGGQVRAGPRERPRGDGHLVDPRRDAVAGRPHLSRGQGRSVDRDAAPRRGREAHGTARSSGISRAPARSSRPCSTSWASARPPAMPATSMAWPATSVPPPSEPAARRIRSARSRPPRSVQHRGHLVGSGWSRHRRSGHRALDAPPPERCCTDGRLPPRRSRRRRFGTPDPLEWFGPGRAGSAGSSGGRAVRCPLV